MAFEVIATTRPPRYTALLQENADVVFRLSTCPTFTDDGMALNDAVVPCCVRRASAIRGEGPPRAFLRSRVSNAERRSAMRGATDDDVARLNAGPSAADASGCTPRPITVKDVRALATCEAWNGMSA